MKMMEGKERVEWNVEMKLHYRRDVVMKIFPTLKDSFSFVFEIFK